MAVQGTIDDLGTPLAEVTFVVVDLETTGGSPRNAAITEIGAVKVRGGATLGEFQTLVNPGTSIPPFIAVLTGITDALVAQAPPIPSVLPAFLEFATGAVLVAHNAPFDISFLRAACGQTQTAWPDPVVVDTARLARVVLPRGEVANHKLGTLAAHVGSGTVPEHRALGDARATVDVLHALLARVGNRGVRSLEDLRAFLAPVRPAVRAKRHLAADLPHAPGVYVFRDGQDRALYVGTSVDIRTRVSGYFTAGERRSRMDEMVSLTARITPVVCATALEARVRELRLIAEHAPPYNRRSKYPERALWVKLTDEPFPRLSVVRQVRADDGPYIGPFPSTPRARLAVEALHDALPLRRCTERLPTVPGPAARACWLAETGSCGAPCVDPHAVPDYAGVVADARRAMLTDASLVTDPALTRLRALTAQERFEEAALLRDRIMAFLRGAERAQRLAWAAAAPEVVAATAAAPGSWEIVLVRHGRLAGTTVTPAGSDPMAAVASLRSSGAVVVPGPSPLPAAHPEETEQVLAWLERPGVRLVDLDGTWAYPRVGAGAARARLLADGLGPVTVADEDTHPALRAASWEEEP